MRYHDISKDDMLNGDGLRVVLWVAGCAHKCDGCHNPVTWDGEGGLPFDANAEAELMTALCKPYISGVTFSGGDPLLPANRAETARLILMIRDKLPGKTIWLYTGYLWEEVVNLDFIPLIDVLVDGKYEKSLNDPKLHWKGSSNQRVIDVKRTLNSGNITLYE